MEVHIVHVQQRATSWHKLLGCGKSTATRNFGWAAIIPITIHSMVVATQSLWNVELDSELQPIVLFPIPISTIILESNFVSSIY